MGFGRRAGRPFAGPLPLLPLQPDHNRDLLRLLRCQIAKAAGGSDRVQRGANLHGGWGRGGKGESGPGAAGAPPLLLHRVSNTSSATLAGVGNPGVKDDMGYARAAPVALKVILLRPPLTVPGARAGGRYLRRLLLRQGRVAGPGPAKSRHAGR